VSIHCEVEIEALPKLHTSVGIDLGIKEFAVCSNGDVVPNPRRLPGRHDRDRNAPIIWSEKDYE
jgi:transposase